MIATVLTFLLIILIYESSSEVVWEECNTFTSEAIQNALNSIWSQQSQKRDFFYLEEKVMEFLREYYYSKRNIVLAQGDFGDVLPNLDEVVTHCSTVEFPVDHDDGQPIDYFVKRYTALSGNSQRSMFLIQGGPGESGEVMEVIALNMMTIMPDTDFYIPDHRGTGRSSRLGCNRESVDNFNSNGYYISENDIAPCLQDIEDEYGSVGYFSVTYAAHDIYEFIQLIDNNLPVSVYGVSYGTYLMNRFIQLYPDTLDYLIIDGVCAPGKCYLGRVSERFDEALRAIFIACENNAYCSDYFENDVFSFYQDVLDRSISDNHCSGILLSVVQTYADNPTYYPLLMPSIYRISRCSLTDIGWFQRISYAVNQRAQLSSVITAQDFPTASQGSQTLMEIIMYSELFGVDENYYDDVAINTFFPVDISLFLSRSEEYDGYLYSDALEHIYPAVTSTKILITNGDFDTRTPASWARYYKANFPDATYVEFHGGAHGLTLSNRNPTRGNHPCATQIMADYVKGYINASDIENHSCFDNLIHPDENVFSEQAILNWFEKYNINNLDPWEGGPLPALTIALIVFISVVSVCVLGLILFCCLT